MPAPQTVVTLVENFERNRDAYHSGQYNETQVRRDFIDPLFKALGWDMDNSLGYAEAYRDVIHEDAIKVGASTRAPDYSFRVGGQRKFFLEAKKPSVNVKDGAEPAFQVRRYAWSAKLPLSIVTNFEEFAIYDCRQKPDKNDKSSKSRLFYCTLCDYADKWEEISAIFSKDAVLKGSFDKYAVTTKGKRGTTEVDGAFLEEIESWRESLAHNIALRNANLSQRELNFAVQQTIDRIIFLRICEDRGIEPYGRLMALQNGANVYARLCEKFRDADERYNSGLFHFTKEKQRAEAPDELTPHLKIDDKALKEIFKTLYYPDCPYEFSVLGADILGSVYEQFLGKVIRLTAGNRAVIEDKPEVKKAGGVYYTPAYIVQYIVQQTVGTILEGKTSKQAEGVTILDPACGSGSFLIGAYQYLLDWYMSRYLAEGVDKHGKGKSARIRPSTSGEWRLTSAEKKRILLEHIYGVDIDAQAVEVTKLSLLLKVLEGESGESLTSQMRLFHERVLPDLERNIQCGNSLVESDFYSGHLDLDDETALRVNVFDWRTSFPQVFKNGGFDTVIGNPPYVRQETLSDFKDYFQAHYEAYDGVADLYAYFMEKGVKLLKSEGLFSIIVSSSFLRANYGRSLRTTLKRHAAVLRMIDFGGLPVFSNAKDTYVCIPLLKNGKQPKRIEVARIASLKSLELDKYVNANRYTVPSSRFSDEAWSLKSDNEAAVFMKIAATGKPLGEYVERKIFYGIKTGLNEAFEVSAVQRQLILKSSPTCASLIKLFLGGQDIRRYRVEENERYLIVLPNGWTRKQSGLNNATEKQTWTWLTTTYPSLSNHLRPFADALRKRQDQGEYWWELRSCDYYQYLEAPKLIFPDICKAPRFALDDSGTYLANTAYCLGTDDRYLLGILNSRLFWFAISHISIPFGMRDGAYRYRLIYQYMEQVPIHQVNERNKSEISTRAKIVALVENTLTLHQQLAVCKTPQDTTLVQRKIAAIDHQIDVLVYSIYGLSEDEIKVLESS